MNPTIATATIRELRTDFRSVKRRIEEHGVVIITDRGVPSYEMRPLEPPDKPRKAGIPDYYARLIKRQPRPMSEAAVRALWEDERRDR